MNTDQLHNFEDIYKHVQHGDAPPCQYIMTSMWRCLDSPFDVLGPIMGSPKGLHHREIHKYVWRSIEEFSQVGFHTDVSVCDGATPNFAFIRMNCSVELDGPIQPWCYNRFSDAALYMWLDSPHGMKTKRNLMTSSHTSGSRLLQISSSLLEKFKQRILDDRKLKAEQDPTETEQTISPPATLSHAPATPPLSTAATPPPSTAATAPVTSANTNPPAPVADRVCFGYQQMIDVFNRLESLRKQGACPAARFLTRDVIFPDQWTKMRVWMAKAWFSDSTVSHLITEVLERPDDKPLLALTVFCDAMQAMYVEGLMSAKTVDSMDHEVISSILYGLDFVLEWWDDWKSTEIDVKSEKNKQFMAHITLLEMLVTCIGALKFTEARVEQQLRVNFRRISQSRLEAVFGEIRSYSTGGLTCSSFLRGYAKLSFLWESATIEDREDAYIGLQIK
jgi:hypothetical protein